MNASINSCLYTLLVTLSTTVIILSLTTAHYYHKYEESQMEIQELHNTSEIQNQTITTLDEQLHTERHISVKLIAGSFALLATVISLLHMTAHLNHFNRPEVQRKILAILWMSPIYSLTSWLSLAIPSMSGYLSLIKDFYEAYIIYQFLSFLIAILGNGNRDTVIEVLARNPANLKPPYKWLNRFFYPPPNHSANALASAVLWECQVFAMQFVLLRPVTSVLLLILDEAGYYGAATSSWDFRAPQFYILIILNISVFFAFTGLLKFYHAVHEHIEWVNPFPKFLCIKGIVFLTFWQGIAISLLVHYLDLQVNTSSYDNTESEDTSIILQNLLISCEMFLFAIAHYCYYPWEEWEEGYSTRASTNNTINRGFGDNFAIGDFANDVKTVINSSQMSMQSRKYAKNNNFDLLPDEQDGSCEDTNNVDDDDDSIEDVTPNAREIEIL